MTNWLINFKIQNLFEALMGLLLKNERGKFSLPPPSPGFELWSPGTKCQCSTNELLWFYLLLKLWKWRPYSVSFVIPIFERLIILKTMTPASNLSEAPLVISFERVVYNCFFCRNRSSLGLLRLFFIHWKYSNVHLHFPPPALSANNPLSLTLESFPQ